MDKANFEKGKSLMWAMVVSMFFWGLSWPSNKVLAGFCSAFNFNVYRYILVVSAMLVMLPLLKVSITVKKVGIPYVLASGILLAVYGYFFFWGLKKGAAGAAGILVTTLNPVMAYLLGIVMDAKKPRINEVIGLVLGAVAGCVLLQIWKGVDVLFNSGSLFLVLAAFVWSLMSKFTSKAAKYGTSLSFSLWQYLVTLLCVLPLADYNEFGQIFQVTDMRFWGNLFFGAVIVTCLATTMFFFATTKLGAEKASSFIFLVPLAAGISSWLLLGEHLKLHTIAGGAIGIAAVYMINKKPKVR